MKERPILFSGPMVRAILEGRKTQTRRVVEPQPGNGWKFEEPPVLGRITSPHPKKGKFGVFIHRKTNYVFPESDLIVCHYGQPGDRLWVRETWSKALHGCGVELLERWEPGREGPFGVGAIYAATPHPDYKPDKWRPSIHMPRWASRITLEVTGVRVERLQEISEQDAEAEGAHYEFKIARRGFEAIWNSISGPESWDANPWVWVVEFRKIMTACRFCSTFFTRPLDEADYAMDYWFLADGSL